MAYKSVRGGEVVSACFEAEGLCLKTKKCSSLIFFSDFYPNLILIVSDINSQHGIQKFEGVGGRLLVYVSNLKNYL